MYYRVLFWDPQKKGASPMGDYAGKHAAIDVARATAQAMLVVERDDAVTYTAVSAGRIVWTRSQGAKV